MMLSTFNVITFAACLSIINDVFVIKRPRISELIEYDLSTYPLHHRLIRGGSNLGASGGGSPPGRSQLGSLVGSLFLSRNESLSELCVLFKGFTS